VQGDGVFDCVPGGYPKDRWVRISALKFPELILGRAFNRVVNDCEQSDSEFRRVPAVDRPSQIMIVAVLAGRDCANCFRTLREGP
jgi:hypothetical protein